jgi:hypothetical protein
MQQDPLAALGLLIRKFGYRIDGGWEVFIPEGVIQELGPNAQIQVEPDWQRKGFKFKVFVNQIVDGTWSEVKEDGSDSSGGPNQLAKTDDQTPA